MFDDINSRIFILVGGINKNKFFGREFTRRWGWEFL